MIYENMSLIGKFSIKNLRSCSSIFRRDKLFLLSCICYAYVNMYGLGIWIRERLTNFLCNKGSMNKFVKRN